MTEEYLPEFPLCLKLANDKLYPFKKCLKCGTFFAAGQLNYNIKNGRFECPHCFAYKRFVSQAAVSREIAENAETQAAKNLSIFKNQFGELAERVKAIELALEDLNGVREAGG